MAKRVYEIFDDPDINAPGSVWVGEAFDNQYPDIVQRIVNRLVKVAYWSTLEANRETQYQWWTRSGSNAYIDNKKSWDQIKDLRTRINPLLDDYYVAAINKSIAETKKYRLTRREVNVEGWIKREYLDNALRDQKLTNYWPTQDASGKFSRA